MWQLELLTPLIDKLNPEAKESAIEFFRDIIHFTNKHLVSSNQIFATYTSLTVIKSLYATYNANNDITSEQLSRQTLGFIIYLTKKNHSKEKTYQIVREFIESHTNVKKTSNFNNLLLNSYEKSADNKNRKLSTYNFFSICRRKNESYIQSFNSTIDQLENTDWTNTNTSTPTNKETLRNILNTDQLINLIQEINPLKDALRKLMTHLYTTYQEFIPELHEKIKLYDKPAENNKLIKDIQLIKHFESLIDRVNDIYHDSQRLRTMNQP